MKKLLLLFIPLVGSWMFAQQTKNVLFIGNSYTYYNNLPMMLAQLANSTGDNITFDSSTPGGYTLNGHSTNATTLQKIQTGNWDFVVLQEQSQFPSFPIGQVQTDCFPYAAKLDSIILAHNPCAETMFYMTWGRQNGDASNCASWPPVCTYEGMDDLLRQRYNQMAVDNQGVLSPVGALWRNIRQNYPALQLYDTDGSHPSLAGSYAAACSFYTTILRKDPTLITVDQGLSASDALIIRNAAKAVVYDSLLTWHIGEYDPVASYTGSQTNGTVTFTNTSTNATSYLWNFGDGTTSTQISPVHAYNSPGVYNVSLTANNCGLIDSTANSYNIVITGLEENSYDKLSFYPNPVKEILTLQFIEADEINVLDAYGKKVEISIKAKQDTYELDFSSQPKGLYFIKIKRGETSYLGKVSHF